MSSIQLLPPDPQTTSSSAPELGLTNSAPSAGAAGDSPFGSVLANAVKAPSADGPPPAASNAPQASEDKSAPPSQDSPAAADPAVATTGANDAQSPQPPLPSSAAANAAPTGRSKSSPSTGNAASNDPSPAPDPASLPGAAPAELVKSLLLSTPQSVASDLAKTGASQTNSTDDQSSAAAQSPATNPPPALIAALNGIGNLPVSPSGTQVNLKPFAPATASTTTTAPAQASGTANDSITIDVQLPAAQIIPAMTTAIATVETSDPKPLDPIVPDSNKTDSPAGPNASGRNSPTVETGTPGPATNISATTQVAAVLPADANGSQNQQDPSQSGSGSTPGNPGEPASQPTGSNLAAVKTVANQSASSVPPAETTVPNLSFGGTQPGAGPAPPVPNSISDTAFDAAKPAPTSTAGDSSPGSQQSGTQNPDYSLFGTPPLSLQTNATTYSAALTGGGNEFNPAQVIEQVAYAIQSTHVSGQEMQFTLNPPDLGSLQVNVSVHDGVLSARLETQSPTTQQILVDNLSQLKDSLSQQGVAFDRIDVRLAGSQTGSGGSGTADPSYGRQPDGGYPWDQSQALIQAHVDDSILSNSPAHGSASRGPLTSLDVMV